VWGCEAHEVKQKKEKNYAVFQFEKYFLYIYDVITWGKEMYALYITTLSLSLSLSLSHTHTVVSIPGRRHCVSGLGVQRVHVVTPALHNCAQQSG